MQGIRVARVLSTVDTENNVIVKVVNCSEEPLVIQKGIMLGLAEKYQPNGYESVRVVDVLEHKEQNNVDNRSHSSSNEEIHELILEKLKHLSESDSEVLKPVLLKHRDLFREDPEHRGCLVDIKHQIHTGDSMPIKKKLYRLPESIKSLIQSHITEMLEKDVIKPSNSPWSSPVVKVPKKSPYGIPKYRFCIDYTALNSITKGDAYPLQNIVETLDCLGNSNYFTTLDLA